MLRLNSEAIEEFRVTTANGTANEGRSAGAQINLMTKSGSNAWHGAAFEFYRGTIFEANDWFSNSTGTSRTPLVRNTFGGASAARSGRTSCSFSTAMRAAEMPRRHRNQTVPLANLGTGAINYTYCTNTAGHRPSASLIEPGPESSSLFSGRHKPCRASCAGCSCGAISGERYVNGR